MLFTFLLFIYSSQFQISTYLQSVMLRFRPIAPKPPAAEQVLSSVAVKFCGKRPKRKYVKVRSRNTRRKPSRKSPIKEMEAMLQLSLERSDSNSRMNSSGDCGNTAERIGNTSKLRCKPSMKEIEAMLQLSLERSDSNGRMNSSGECGETAERIGNTLKSRCKPSRKSPMKEMEAMLELSLERSDSNGRMNSSGDCGDTAERIRNTSKSRCKPSMKEMEAMLQLSLERSNSNSRMNSSGDCGDTAERIGNISKSRCKPSRKSEATEMEAMLHLSLERSDSNTKTNSSEDFGETAQRIGNTLKSRRKPSRFPSQKSRIEDKPSPNGTEALLHLSLERSDSNTKTNSSDDCSNTSAAERIGNSGGSVIKTWIVVESVTAGESGGVGLGFTDWEKINRLSADTCPGFVSDGRNNVIWINEAYRRMVGEGENGEMVRLAVKDEFPDFTPSFACRARMSQRTKEGQTWNRIVACDVWRMEVEGFAWKLDVETAIGLGI